MTDFILKACVSIITIPLVVFYSVKLGTYAYLKMTRKFQQDFPEKGKE